MKRLLGLLMTVGVLVGLNGCGTQIKVWTDIYKNGNTLQEYQYYHHPKTNKRIRDGWYKVYYENGEYYEIGTYKEDVRDGEWSDYTKDGQENRVIWKDGAKWSGVFGINVNLDSIWIETEDERPDDDKIFRGLITYDGGLWNGSVVLYWMNENKRIEGLWKEGRHGKWNWYYESGEVEEEGHYVDGEIQGEYVWYYESGEVDQKGHYVDGKQQGEYVLYYESGGMKIEATLVDGNLQGKVFLYYQSGGVEEEENYVDGTMHGEYVWYYESGEVKEEGNYVDGKRQGKWVYHDEDGSITDEDIYKDGKCVEMCEGNQ